MEDIKRNFWSMKTEEIFTNLKTGYDGLTQAEARRRLQIYGSNVLKAKKSQNLFKLLISQFKSPILLILFFAIGLSFFLGDTADAVIILVIVLVSGLLGFWQEYGRE